MILHAFDTGTWYKHFYMCAFYLWMQTFEIVFRVTSIWQLRSSSRDIRWTSIYMLIRTFQLVLLLLNGLLYNDNRFNRFFLQLNSHPKVHSNNIPNCCFIDNGHRNKTFRIVVGYGPKIKVTLSYTGTKLEKFNKHIYSHLHSHSGYFDVLRIYFFSLSYPTDKSFIMKHIFVVHIKKD